MSFVRRVAALAVLAPSVLSAQTAARTAATKVGPPRGTVMVVGGGSMGPEIYAEFIKAAGGPDALIIDVPNAGGGESYSQDAAGTRGFKAAGAKNVYVLHTRDRKLADSDSFVAVIKKAGGVWFEGGRQFHLVNDYGGTKTETAFREVLERGGVVGGSSAGASILGDFLVRGAPSSNNRIMDFPGYQRGFAYLRNTGIDQHVVARERLPDLADSIITKYPNMLAISEDEGTAWVVRGDTGTIIGRSKAFVYNGAQNDPGSPFLTLWPGDVYNLATRTVIRRAIEGSLLTVAFVDSVFSRYADPARGGATVLVAHDGKVLVNKSWGIAPQARYMPTTTVPQFNIGAMSAVFTSLCAQLPEPPAGRGNAPARDSTRTDSTPPTPATSLTPMQRCVTRQVGQPVGMHKTNATADDQLMSNVDELYRLDLGLQNPRTWRDVDLTKGWESETAHGVARLGAFAVAGGKRSAFVRVPDKKVTVILLTNDDSADAKGMANRIVDRLVTAGHH